MQRLEVSGAVRPLYGSLGVKGLRNTHAWVLALETKQTGGKLLSHSDLRGEGRRWLTLVSAAINLRVP